MKYIKSLCFIGIICLLLTGCGLAGGHKNTTGSTIYTDSDVTLNCTNTNTSENRTLTTYVDVLFNTTRGYQAEQHFKLVAKYNETISDEKYKEILKEVDASQCLFASDCKDDHLELGLTTLGFNTVVDRNGDTIQITFYKANGQGFKANQTDIDLVKKTYEGENFTCN